MTTAVIPKTITDFQEPQKTDIEVLGLPEKKAKQLRSAGINTIEELVRFLPTSYKDYSNETAYGDIKDGQDCVVSGTILSVKLRITGKVTLVSALMQDSEGNQVSAVWFNQHYVSKLLETGKKYYICGKAKLDPSGKYPPSITVARYDKAGDNILKITPRYKKIRGMSEDYLVDLIKNAMASISKADHIHNAFVTKCRLMPEYQALQCLHFPNSEKEIEYATTRMNFDKLLPFAYKLRQMAKERTQPSGYVFSDTTWVNDIKASLPYSLTADQDKVLSDIIMETGTYTQLHALIQGDVGCGKTIVAFMLMVAAAQNKIQSCMLAPTEILAVQHYEDAVKTLGKLPITIKLLTGSMTAAQKKDCVKGLKDGSVDIVIGTHAVLQKSVSFNNLGLVIIDEQHRFGVSQREKLLEKSAPHVVSMSATPIPRTLSMALHGEHTKVYNITTKPAGRHPIQTAVINNPKPAYKFMYDQIKAGRQAYVICPFIEDNEDYSEVESVTELQKQMEKGFAFDPKIKLGVVHGKMKKDEMDKVIADFVKNDIQILISTTVVEVGVNVPNASVITIMNAERFGLAQLHQLRGRVGRSGHKSFCILVSDSAAERLNILTKTTDGFEIAQEDIKLRGHGSYLGTKQSGQESEVELMLAKPILYKLAQGLSKYIDNNPILKEQYKYLEEDY